VGSERSTKRREGLKCENPVIMYYDYTDFEREKNGAFRAFKVTRGSSKVGRKPDKMPLVELHLSAALRLGQSAWKRLNGRRHFAGGLCPAKKRKTSSGTNNRWQNPFKSKGGAGPAGFGGSHDDTHAWKFDPELCPEGRHERGELGGSRSRQGAPLTPAPR